MDDLELPTEEFELGQLRQLPPSQILVTDHHNADDHGYPPVNIQKTVENHHVLCVIQLFQWQFSIANC